MRDKYLTKAMGECWHVLDCCPEKDSDGITYHCELCNADFSFSWDKVGSSLKFNNDFSTWEGFGKLWEFCQKQEWWENLGNYLDSRTDVPESLVHPDRFADAVFSYLKERDK